MQAEALFRHYLDDVAQHIHAVGVFVPVVRFGEVIADVSQSRRGEHGVHEGMDGDVAVAVRDEPAVAGDSHAADSHVIFIRAEGVRVHAEADASARRAEVLPVGDFAVGGIAREQARARDVGGIHGRIVCEVLFARQSIRLFDILGVKALRRLHGEEDISVGHALDVAPLRHDDGVGGGQGTDPAPVLLHAGDTVGNDFSAHEHPRAVVDEHDVARDFCERVFHRAGARVAAAHGFNVGVRRGDFLHLLLVLPGDGEDDFVDVLPLERAQRVLDDGEGAVFDKQFIFCKARARAAARGADDNGCFHLVLFSLLPALVSCGRGDNLVQTRRLVFFDGLFDGKHFEGEFARRVFELQHVARLHLVRGLHALAVDEHLFLRASLLRHRAAL